MELEMNGNSKLLKGMLLVAGTSIGGGMLALPVLTSMTGFIPSLILYLICWLFMASTGLLFLEVAMWFKRDVNIITMAERTLGKAGKAFAWILYLFLFYCLTLAYIVGVGDLMQDVLNMAVSTDRWQGQLLFLLVFAPFVYAGTRVIGPLNVILMIGLAASFLAFIIFGLPHVNLSYLTRTNWKLLWTAFPITFLAFAYHGIIPTLINYLDRDVRKSRLAIIIGSFLPFVAYAIWQWLILGIVPAEGPHSLQTALELGQTAVHPLKNVLEVPGIYTIGKFFAFFALVTSFFGVTLGLMDFFADGFNIEKTALNKLFLCILILLPPLALAFIYPHIFLIALDYAGGFGSALLLGLLPILMVWIGRYHLGLSGEYKFAGGKGLLSLLFILVILEVCCEIALTVYFKT